MDEYEWSDHLFKLSLDPENSMISSLELKLNCFMRNIKRKMPSLAYFIEGCFCPERRMLSWPNYRCSRIFRWALKAQPTWPSIIHQERGYHRVLDSLRLAIKDSWNPIAEIHLSDIGRLQISIDNLNQILLQYLELPRLVCDLTVYPACSSGLILW
jgi:hypothetical protein